MHTPPELARYVVRAADRALREDLGLEGGLGDLRLSILDPACGPGAFLAATIAALGEAEGARAGGPSLAGWDLDPAAIRGAEALLSGAAAARGLRLSLRACDALREPPSAGEGGPILILGNPPWAARSASRDEAGDRLLGDFRLEEDGSPLAEKKVGVLSDDYVRFFRWAAEAARRAPHGAVLALVTNASYLDGVAHRGMRGALLRWFDAIAVADLGGSALIARDGAPDANLFGVRPSAALTLLTRRPRPPGRRAEEPRARAAVRYQRLRGDRAHKRRALLSGELGPAKALVPAPPHLRFVPRARPRSARYEAWPSLAALIPFHREGLQSNRDAFVTDRDRGALLERLRRFARGRRGEAQGAEEVPGARRHWDPESARALVRLLLAEDPEGEALLRPIAYRPGEVRWAALHRGLFHRPRPELCAALAASELALVTVRKDRGERPWAHFAAARLPIDSCFLSTRSSCRARAFPSHGPDGRENLDRELAEAWGARAGAPIRSAELLAYALAVLAAPSYRARFVDDLRADYPRLPSPPDAETYAALVALGRRLAEAFTAPAAAPSATSPGAAQGSPVVVGHHLLPSPALGAWIEEAEARLGPTLEAVPVRG